MNEFESKKLLKSRGIDVPEGRILETRAELASVSKYPVVLKVCSEKILHKSDVGGVITGIKDSAELEKAFELMSARFPGEKLLLEEMISEKGVEAIVGIGYDRDFGRFIMAGLGGVLAELYHDVSFRLLPITEKDAEDLVQSLKGKKIFNGFRGIRTANRAFYDLLLKVALLAEERDIRDMDLNPVLITDRRAVVLDAKIVEAKK